MLLPESQSQFRGVPIERCAPNGIRTLQPGRGESRPYPLTRDPVFHRIHHGLGQSSADSR